MRKRFFTPLIVATFAATAVVLSACSGGAATPSASPAGSYDKALSAAYDGVVEKPTIDPVEVSGPEQNVAIISCSLTLESCRTQADAVSAAVTELGWWPMVIDGESANGYGTAVRQAIAQSATAIVVTDTDCSSAAAYFAEAHLAQIPVIALGGKDDCKPAGFDVATRWTMAYPESQRAALAGKLQADYAYGSLKGDVKALVLTQSGSGVTAVAAKAFTAELTALGSGKVVQTLELGAGEIADGTFVAKVVEAAQSAGANIIVCPDDSWVTTGGLGKALMADSKTKKVVIVGRGGSAEDLDAIRAGKTGLVATVAQAFDWQAAGTVDALLRLLAGQKQVLIGDAMQVVDATHNMPESGGYVSEIDGTSIFLSARVIPTSSPSPTPSEKPAN